MSIAENVAERFLSDSWWGWHNGVIGLEYRAPLPPTELFPVRERPGGSFGPIQMPPYIVARQHGELVTVMLCESTGLRANTRGITVDEYYHPETKITDDEWIQIGSDNEPPEWTAPIEQALFEMRLRWPDIELEFGE